MPNYTVNDIAKIFKVTKYTVWRWIKSGKLHAYKLGAGGTWRVDEDDLQKFKAS